MLVNPWQFGGPIMRTVSKALVYVVLVCLLLSWASGARRPFRRASMDQRFGREHRHVLARLRRCREDNPDHHPVRPCKNLLLPPDEEDGDRARPHARDAHQCLCSTRQDQSPRALFPAYCTRPLPTDVPRHQTFCLLLI